MRQTDRQRESERVRRNGEKRERERGGGVRGGRK